MTRKYWQFRMMGGQWSLAWCVGTATFVYGL
jgi:hypothetical protein